MENWNMDFRYDFCEGRSKASFQVSGSQSCRGSISFYSWKGCPGNRGDDKSGEDNNQHERQDRIGGRTNGLSKDSCHPGI